VDAPRREQARTYFLIIAAYIDKVVIYWKNIAQLENAPKTSAGLEFGFISAVELIDEVYRIDPNGKITRHRFSAFGLQKNPNDIPLVTAEKIECLLRTYMRQRFTVG
jgi:hypothetical protein